RFSLDAYDPCRSEHSPFPHTAQRRYEGALSHYKTKPSQDMKKSCNAKLWKVMQLCALQWMMPLAFAGGAVANSVGAQVLDREISISLAGVPFEETLHRIQDLTNVKFFYSPGQLAGEGPVSMHVDGWTLGEVLEELLRPRGIEYKVH